MDKETEAIELVKLIIRKICSQNKFSKEELDICLKIWDDFTNLACRQTGKRKRASIAKPEAWAAAVIYTFGRANFKNKLTADTIRKTLAVTRKSIYNKFSEIKDVLKMKFFDTRYCTKEVLEQNPLKELVVTEDGFILPKEVTVKEELTDEEVLSIFKEADKQAKSSNYGKAVIAYRKVLQAPNQDIKIIELAHSGIGEAYLNLYKFDLAEKHLKEAIKMNQTEPSYHYLLGCNYSNWGKSAKGIKELRLALALNPNHPPILQALGWTLHFSGKREEGVRLLKKALELDPKNPLILCDLGVAYASEYKFGEAIVCLEEAVKIAPDDSYVTDTYNHVKFFEQTFKQLSKRNILQKSNLTKDKQLKLWNH
ncbi:MAG: DUF6398 domain-containing protein [bacterium]|nr:DUF6398 domain-containing protein [bacterium]